MFGVRMNKLFVKLGLSLIPTLHLKEEMAVVILIKGVIV